MMNWKYALAGTMIGSALVLGACNSNNSNGAGDNTGKESTTNEEKPAGDEAASIEGKVHGDGSSTVAPIMEAINEEYSKDHPKVEVSIGISGTGGGFEKFSAGETDFANASRPIKDEEKDKLKEKKIDYTEFQIGYDGLSIVVNKENDWAKDIKVEDLRKMWTEDGKEKMWSDINPAWPKEKIVFYAPGTDSGTYDYFHEEILDKKDMVKSATLSEDDNIIVQGVEGDKNAIGFFGFAYYVENKDKLNVLKVDGVEPTHDTIKSGTYKPLSRPLFIYAKNSALKDNKAFADFMTYTLDNAGEMAEATGYVRATDEQYAKDKELLNGLK